MIPIKLTLNDFASHSYTEIDFNNFSSALVVGKVKGNDHISNGAGKSTIFNAIEYVLFNEIKFSTLDRIIKDGKDIARVSFEFVSPHDNEVYKIVRSISKKSGSDLRLYKKINEEWDDITQRRINDNEKEINKLLKINYKTFCASVLFSQIGSENPSQREFYNIAQATPDKRKLILKEVLNLSNYANYEKIAKNKLQIISKEIDRQKAILSTFEDPEVNIKKYKDDLIATELKIEKNNDYLNNLLNNNSSIDQQINDINNNIKLIENNQSSILSEKIKIENELFSLNKEVDSNILKIKSIKNDGKKISLLVDELKNNLSKYDNINFDEEINTISSNIDKISSKISDNQININTLKNKKEELLIPLPSGPVCNHCRQSLTEEHIQSCKEKITKDLSDIQEKIVFFQNENLILNKEKDLLQNNLKNLKKDSIIFIDLKNNLALKNKELEHMRQLFSELNNIYQKNKEKLELLKIELSKVEEKLSQMDTSNVENFKKDLLSLIKNKEINLNKISLYKKDYEDLLKSKNIIEHKIEENLDKIEKIKEIKASIKKLENDYLIIQQVCQAFSTKGIPSLIINNILDDYQTEANEWLFKFRPGLQLQFSVIKAKSNTDQEDTLDINYIIDGNTREYKQLSGAQKLIASLSLKLALSSLIKKRLGVDLKILLLDEVDQALDENGVNIFSDIIKELQKDFKILVITHNNKLKDRFTHAILVEQDDDLTSTAKLVNNW